MSTTIYWLRCLVLDGLMFALAAAAIGWNISGAWDVFIFWNWVIVALGFLVGFSPKPPKFEPRRPGAALYHWITEILTISILVLGGHPIGGAARLLAAVAVESERYKQAEGGAA